LRAQLAATFVNDHDGLIGQFVFDDAVLNRAREIVRAAAGSGCHACCAQSVCGWQTDEGDL
jgi:hypothetical protein